MRTLDLMRYSDREKFQFHFCALSGLPGSLDDEIRALGGEVHYCRLDWRFPFRFRKLLKDNQIDIVHSHVHYFSGFIVRQAAKAGVQRRIAHFRSTQDDFGNNLRRKIQRSLMKRWVKRYATDILAVCEGAMVSAWGPRWSDDPRSCVIYNGIDLKPYLEHYDPHDVFNEFGLPFNACVYIHVGRMDPPKNHQRLIEIFSEIARLQPAAYLLLVGRENDVITPMLRTKVQELGLINHVIFAGERSDVPRLLQAADCMIFPSLREGLPGAVLEACAAGTPVLASNLPGIIEISERLPLVHCLSLNVPNNLWASTARELFSTCPQDRQAAKQAFAQSDFNIQNSARAHQKIWQNNHDL